MSILGTMLKNRRAGGREVSPPLSWSAAPEGTAELLLVMEDPDAPMGKPFVHCVAGAGVSPATDRAFVRYIAFSEATSE